MTMSKGSSSEVAAEMRQYQKVPPHQVCTFQAQPALDKVSAILCDLLHEQSNGNATVGRDAKGGNVS